MRTSLKTHIDTRLSDLTVDADLTEKILLATTKKQSTRPIKGLWKRNAVITAAACLCLMFSATALAGTVPAVNNLLYHISPEIAQFLQPVNKAAEDNGIKMEVLAAMNDGTTAVAYISLQDLTGNRIDATTDLYNYTIKGATALTHEIVSYDAETNTAVIRLLGTGGDDLDGKKNTLSVTSFLSNKIEYENFETGIALSALIAPNTGYTPLSNFFYSGGGEVDENLYDTIYQKGAMNVLTPDVMAVSFKNGIDFVTVSNAGFVDGYFHLQTKWTESVDNHGDIYMLNRNGERINSVSFYFRTDTDAVNGSAREKHIEYVFDVTKDQLDDCTLWAYFSEDGDYTQGNWQVTFTLDSLDKEKLMVNTLDFADSLEVTPIGAYIKGYSLSANPADLVITMDDGTEISTSVRSAWQRINGKQDIRFLFQGPIDVDHIRSITINGDTVYS